MISKGPLPPGTHSTIRLFRRLVGLLLVVLAPAVAAWGQETPQMTEPVSFESPLSPEALFPPATETPIVSPDAAAGDRYVPPRLRGGGVDLYRPRMFRQTVPVAQVEPAPDTPEIPEPDDTVERFESRLKVLENALKKMEAGQKAGANRPTVRVAGRLQIDYWSYPQSTPGIGYFENPTTGNDPENEFLFRRVWLSALGTIKDNMLYKIELNFAPPQDPSFRDVYLGFTDLVLLQTVLFGHQKRPIGFDQLNTSRLLTFMERSMVTDAFNRNQRRLGAMSYGHTDDLRAAWQVGIFELDDLRDTGRYLGDPLQLSFNSRLVLNPWYDEVSGGRSWGHFAVSNMIARPDGFIAPGDSHTNTARFRTRTENRSVSTWLDTGAIAGAQWFDTAGLEAAGNFGSLLVVSELMGTPVDRTGGPDLFFWGGYIYAAYFLTGEFQPYDRKAGVFDRPHPLENFFLVDRFTGGGTGSGWGAWEVAARYSYVDLTDRDIRGGRGSDVTLGLNWWFNPYAKVQFNYIFGDISGHAPVGGYTGGQFTNFGTRMAMDF